MYIWLSSFLFAVFGFLASRKLRRYIRNKFLITVGKIVENVFKKADIEINGNRPWDVKINKKQTLNLVKRIIGQFLGFNRTGNNHILITCILFGICQHSIYANKVL